MQISYSKLWKILIDKGLQKQDLMRLTGMSFSSNAPYLATKKDLLAYLVSVQQTFSVGKGSNSNETKILRFRYRFDSRTHSLNWSPYYSASDYNFYNDDYISFQIDHLGIDGTIRGFQTESDIRNYLEA